VRGRTLLLVLSLASLGLFLAPTRAAERDPAGSLAILPGEDALAAPDLFRVSVDEGLSVWAGLPAGATMRVDAALVVHNAGDVPVDVSLPDPRVDGAETDATARWILPEGGCRLAPLERCTVGLVVEA
jgi:hypothetical protein